MNHPDRESNATADRADDTDQEPEGI